MALPAVPAWWLVDYFTAREVFQSTDAALRRKMRKLCENGRLKYSAYEHSDFRKNAKLKLHFIDNQNCRCDLDLSIAQAASALPDRVDGKKVHPADQMTKIMVACGIVHNCGLVSAKTGLYLTPIELGLNEELVCMPMAQFQNLL